jgi:ATP-dependent DNA ligase
VGPQWVHEIKHDGYRLIARKRDGRVRLLTRRSFDWTDRYPLIREAVAALAPASAVIDGEAVWCDGDGLAVFDKLHSRACDGEVSDPAMAAFKSRCANASGGPQPAVWSRHSSNRRETGDKQK